MSLKNSDLMLESRKTLCEKVKMLVPSIFSIFHNNFKRLSFTGLFGLPFPKQATVLPCLQYKSFENTVEKGEIAHNKQCLLFPQCFLPVWGPICHFQQI